MSYCSYYQANVRRADCWFFVSILRTFEYVVFDRTLDAEESLFEFFVPPAMEPTFLEFMNYFMKDGLISNLKKLPNRLEAEGSVA